MTLKKLLTAFPLLTLLFFSSTLNAAVAYSAPLSVDGEEFEIGNLLEWRTSSEIESAYFFIEKSLDGVSFENIGKVEAAGNSDEEVSYRYMDIQVIDEEAFYRLRQTDIDGTESLSDAVMVKKEMTNQFMIINFSTITVTSLFEVTIDAMTEGEMEYSLISYRGEEIFSAKQQVINGLNEFQINLEDEKEGKYKIVFRMDDEEEKLNLMKVDDEIKKKPNVASKRSSSGG